MHLNGFSVFVVGLVFSCGKCSKELHHKPEQDFGRFYDWEYCPPGTYANSFEIKIHSTHQAIHDDLGITGMRLFCNDPAGEVEPETIASYSLQEGNWKGEQTCPKGEWLVGFKVQIQMYQGIFKDDSGANNVQMMCSSSLIMDGRGESKGTWTTLARCGKNEAICGLRTKVEDLAIGDEVGLVALRMKCCELQSPVNTTGFSSTTARPMITTTITKPTITRSTTTTTGFPSTTARPVITITITKPTTNKSTTITTTATIIKPNTTSNTAAATTTTTTTTKVTPPLQFTVTATTTNTNASNDTTTNTNATTTDNMTTNTWATITTIGTIPTAKATPLPPLLTVTATIANINVITTTTNSIATITTATTTTRTITIHFTETTTITSHPTSIPISVTAITTLTTKKPTTDTITTLSSISSLHTVPIAFDTKPGVNTSDRPRTTREPVDISRETPVILGRTLTTEDPKMTTSSPEMRTTEKNHNISFAYPNNSPQSDKPLAANDHTNIQDSVTSSVTHEKEPHPTTNTNITPSSISSLDTVTTDSGTKPGVNTSNRPRTTTKAVDIPRETLVILGKTLTTEDPKMPTNSPEMRTTKSHNISSAYPHNSSQSDEPLTTIDHTSLQALATTPFTHDPQSTHVFGVDQKKTSPLDISSYTTTATPSFSQKWFDGDVNKSTETTHQDWQTSSTSPEVRLKDDDSYLSSDFPTSSSNNVRSTTPASFHNKTQAQPNINNGNDLAPNPTRSADGHVEKKSKKSNPPDDSSSTNITLNKDSPKIDPDKPFTFPGRIPIDNHNLNNTFNNKGVTLNDTDKEGAKTTKPPSDNVNSSNEQTNSQSNYTHFGGDITDQSDNETYDLYNGRQGKSLLLPLSGHEITEKQRDSFNPMFLAITLFLTTASLFCLTWFIYLVRKRKKRARRKSQVDPRYKYVIRVQQVQPINLNSP